MSNTDSIIQKVHHLSALLSRKSDQILQQQLAIGLSQYKILVAVEDNPRLQQRAIAVQLGQTEASVSRQVKLLTKKGLITSRANPTNRREHLTELTVQGKRIVDGGKEALAVYHRSLTSHLSPRQQEILLGLLNELR